MTEAQLRFLRLLAAFNTAAPRSELPLADRKEDRARQSCRRAGLAKWGRRQSDKTNGWWITAAGRRALEPKP